VLKRACINIWEIDTTELAGKGFLAKFWASGDAGRTDKWREAPLAKLTNGEELQAWLRQRARPFWAVIAARIILRGLPVEGKDSPRDLFLPAFRAAAVSWTASRYPAHETELAAAAEAAAGFAFAAGPKAYPTYVAAAVVSKACGATDVGYFADTVTAEYPTAAAAIWPEISNMQRVRRRAWRLPRLRGYRCGVSVKERSS
jgi:hypothetical protein